MTDAPERIWAIGFTGEAWNVGKWSRQDTRAFYPDAERYIRADLLDAHIGAVLEEAVEIVECGCGEDGCEMPFSCARKEAERILALRPNALQALERVRREARVDGMRAALAACDPTSYRAHHASVRRRCQEAIRAMIAAEERGEGE